MKSAATIFAAVASMALVSACATATADANGQTSNDSGATRVVSGDEAGAVERDVRVRRLVRRGIDAESIIENYDSDEDGRISRAEYNDRPNRDRFDALDADEDGFVDLAELESDMEERIAERMERHAERMTERVERHAERMERHAERAMRNAERYQERILERLDRNGDGEVNEDDFDFDFNFEFDGEGFRERMQEHRARSLKKLDSDGDGVVSREEFAARQNKRFDKLDKDQNGTLSADELGGMEMMRGFAMPDFERFGMGRHGGRKMFLWNDRNDGEADEESGETEE